MALRSRMHIFKSLGPTASRLMLELATVGADGYAEDVIREMSDAAVSTTYLAAKTVASAKFASCPALVALLLRAEATVTMRSGGCSAPSVPAVWCRCRFPALLDT